MRPRRRPGTMPGHYAAFGAALIGAWACADQSTPRALLFNTGNTKAPAVCTWNGTSWSAATTLADLGQRSEWISAAACPVRNEMVGIFFTNSKRLKALVYNGAWSAAGTELIHSAAATLSAVAYEQRSGDALAVYSTDSASSVAYVIWNGSTWSAEHTFSTGLSGSLTGLRLVYEPGTDEIMFVGADSARCVYAAVWNGAAFADGITLETNAPSSSAPCVDAGYTGDGDGLVVWGELNESTPRYRRWTCGSWAAEGLASDVGAAVLEVRFAPNPAGADAILMTRATNQALALTRWDGTQWEAAAALDVAVSSTYCGFDAAFEPDGSQAIAAWGGSGRSALLYRVWDGSAWSATVQGPSLARDAAQVRLSFSATGHEILAAACLASTAELRATSWNGTGWTTAALSSSGVSGGTSQQSFALCDCPHGGLIARWCFEDSTADCTANANDGTLVSSDGDEWTTGVVGSRCVNLDGIDDAVRTAADAVNLQITRDYSVAFWVRADPTQQSGAGLYAKTATSGGAVHWGLEIAPNMSDIIVRHATSSTWTTGLTLETIGTTWTHVAIVYERAAQSIKSYKNGTLAATGTLGAPATGTSRMSIGASADGIAFRGALDEMRVYNRTLSPAELLALATGRTTTPGIMSWREKRN